MLKTESLNRICRQITSRSTNYRVATVAKNVLRRKLLRLNYAQLRQHWNDDEIRQEWRTSIRASIRATHDGRTLRGFVQVQS